ncbi:hypothetical protein Hanom_Chr07g00586441 [Helianthus anomalus]
MKISASWCSDQAFGCYTKVGQLIYIELVLLFRELGNLVFIDLLIRLELEWRMQSIMADFGRVSMMLALGSLSYLGGNVRFTRWWGLTTITYEELMSSLKINAFTSETFYDLGLLFMHFHKSCLYDLFSGNVSMTLQSVYLLFLSFSCRSKQAWCQDQS